MTTPRKHELRRLSLLNQIHWIAFKGGRQTYARPESECPKDLSFQLKRQFNLIHFLLEKCRNSPSTKFLQMTTAERAVY